MSIEELKRKEDIKKRDTEIKSIREKFFKNVIRNKRSFEYEGQTFYVRDISLRESQENEDLFIKFAKSRPDFETNRFLKIDPIDTVGLIIFTIIRHVVNENNVCYFTDEHFNAILDLPFNNEFILKFKNVFYGGAIEDAKAYNSKNKEIDKEDEKKK